MIGLTTRISSSSSVESEGEAEVKLPVSQYIQGIKDAIHYAEKQDNVEVRFLRQLRGLLYNAQQEKLEKHKQKTILDYCKDM